MSEIATGDLWVSSGHHLLDRDENGRLVITDEFLKAYLARPEIVPPDDACATERRVHGRLLLEPRAEITTAEIRAMQDRDARENWRHLLGFRDALVKHPTLEGAYLALIRAKQVTTPPLFLNQLVHLILRNILDGERDPFVWRAAELMFRPQRLTLQDGVLLLADEELVDDTQAADRTSPLIAIFGDARARALDVMTTETAAQYPARSDAFDMVLDFRHGEPGRRAFATILERWIAHLLGSDVSVTPIERFEEQGWSWFVGLDAEGTSIGNALWQGEEPPQDGLNRIVALFQARVHEPGEMLEAAAGKPFPLILAMTSNRIVRVKPQNVLTGLPLKRLSAQSWIS
jgi:Family of unknown function (DUF6352)